MDTKGDLKVVILVSNPARKDELRSLIAIAELDTKITHPKWTAFFR